MSELRGHFAAEANTKSHLFTSTLDVIQDDAGLLRTDGGSNCGVLFVRVADHHFLRPLHQAIKELGQDALLNKHSCAIGAHLDQQGKKPQSTSQPLSLK